MTFKMQKKLLGTYIIIISVTMIITVLFSWNKVNDYIYRRIEVEAQSQVKLLFDILQIYEDNNLTDMQAFVVEYAKKTDARITIIDTEGVVVAESESNKVQMDNHKYREEIVEAIETGQMSSSMRYSKTMKAYMYYVAIPFELDDFNGVLRTATKVQEIESIILDMIVMILVGIVIGSLVAFLVAYFITKRLMKPIQELTYAAIKITEGSYEEKIYINQKDEIGQLAEAFNSMTLKHRINLWKLEQKNAELESILSSMSNGIVVIDNDYKVALHNEKFMDLFNIADESIEGKLFYEVTRNLVVFEVVEKSLELREFIVKEAKVHNTEGEKTYLIYANPIRSNTDSSKSLGSLLVVQDVTQIRKLENVRSDFVSNVTHELKTPLTSIRGFVETLKQGAMNEKEVAMRFLDIIDIEAERLETLIQDILALSEIESMLGDKNINAYDIGKIAEEVVEILRPELQDKDIEMRLNIEENIKPYQCNKDRIKQLLINLIDNAIKYTDKGYVEITCREDFKFLVIEIEDTGIGIDKKHIPRLFERFYRVDKGRSRKMGGTGLGLSIVKHIVELYNGKIRVESKVSKGTKMIIRLPY